ncbi:unnamed protein product [Camellia sinensis]
MISTPNRTDFEAPSKLTERDHFIILGCDGLWGVFGPSDAIQFVHKLLKCVWCKMWNLWCQLHEMDHKYAAVSISSEDKRAVESKGFGRKVVDKLYKTYSFELAGKGFAYDGEKSLYTVGPLPQNNFEFTVVLEESFAKRMLGVLMVGALVSLVKGQSVPFSQKFYAAKIPLKSISLVLQGSEPKNIQDTLRVLDIILRQQAANRQSFFHDDSRNFTAIGGGVTGCRGFHSSFRPTHGGLSLNMGNLRIQQTVTWYNGIVESTVHLQSCDADLADAVIKSLPYVGAMAVSNLESLVPLGSVEELLAAYDSQRRELPPPVTLFYSLVPAQSLLVCPW